MIEAKVICDSISEGKRITTFTLKFPRYVHSQLMTHRALSKNGRSSRAVPLKKAIKEVIHDPVIPVHFGKDKPGMQAFEELSGIRKFLAKRLWLWSRWPAVIFAYLLGKIGLHKQITSRILEPWEHMIVVCTGTEWDNFYYLRCSEHAHPDIRLLAEKMLEAHNNSVPTNLSASEWHLPFVKPEERHINSNYDLIKFSVARCARVSYLNHDKSNPNPQKDIDLHYRLLKNGHMSAFEHQAYPSIPNQHSGNFIGWTQYRKRLKGECITSFEGLKK